MTYFYPLAFKKTFLFFVFVSFFCHLPVHSYLNSSEVPLIETRDIPQIMGKIFTQHVENQVMTPTILERSFNTYLDHFDSERAYLLESEVLPFLSLSGGRKEQILLDYQKKNFDIYRSLNHLIQKGIHRSRLLRKELYREWKSLVYSTDTFIFPETDESVNIYDLPYEKSKAGLKKIIKINFMYFLTYQESLLGKSYLLKNKEQVIDFYERQIRSIENKYLFQDDNGELISSKEKENLLSLYILKALAGSLDSHSAYYDALEAYEMRTRLEKGFKGIGIVLQEEIHGVVIVRLISGGPAEKSKKVKEGDRIVSVDGKNVKGLSFDVVLELLRGRDGSDEIVIGLVHKGEEKTKDVTLIREEVIVNDERVDVSYQPFAGGIIGKITLHSFYEGHGISSEQDIKHALKELQENENLLGIVLDLRENAGGFLMQAVKVAGLFISNGVVVTSKYSGGYKKIFRDIDGRDYFNGPLVVLTSKMSASAAEIVAQALQDYGVAVVVGDEKTYGKGSIQHQTVTDEESNAFFKVTVGRYYTVSGKSTQINGVRADIVVPSIHYKQKVGEEYLDYPLAHDTISSAFSDPLEDMDSDLKNWYLRYYIPTLERSTNYWTRFLPILQKNSAYRLVNNHDFQYFLGSEEKKENDLEEDNGLESNSNNYGIEDLQMMEAVNIVKDMIFLDQKYQEDPRILESKEELSFDQLQN